VEATEGVLYGIEAQLEVCYHSVQTRARCIQNGVVCVGVDQTIIRSKSDIIDTVEARSLHTHRLESLKFVFQPLHTFLESVRTSTLCMAQAIIPTIISLIIHCISGSEVYIH
jgi:hypothetical protein